VRIALRLRRETTMTPKWGGRTTAMGSCQTWPSDCMKQYLKSVGQTLYPLDPFTEKEGA